MEAQQIRVQASGISFAALAWGPDDGPLALCLHGYPDTAWTWRHLGPYLAQRGWRVVAPYMRGYAPTELAPDGNYQVAALTRDALGLIDALGASRRAVLIGHDWGAAATYTAASFSPKRLDRIVTLAIPPPAALARAPRSSEDLVLIARQLRHSWYMLYQQLPRVSERSLPTLVPRLWKAWSPHYDGSEDVARVLESLRGEHAGAALGYYRALLQPWRRSREYAAERRHELRRPRVLTLYLHGEDDGCVLADWARRSRPLLPDRSEVEVVPGAGHFLQLEQSDLVNDKIARFIG